MILLLPLMVAIAAANSAAAIVVTCRTPRTKSKAKRKLRTVKPQPNTDHLARVDDPERQNNSSNGLDLTVVDGTCLSQTTATTRIGFPQGTDSPAKTVSHPVETPVQSLQTPSQQFCTTSNTVQVLPEGHAHSEPSGIAQTTSPSALSPTARSSPFVPESRSDSVAPAARSDSITHTNPSDPVSPTARSDSVAPVTRSDSIASASPNDYAVPVASSNIIAPTAPSNSVAPAPISNSVAPAETLNNVAPASSSNFDAPAATQITITPASSHDGFVPGSFSNSSAHAGYFNNVVTPVAPNVFGFTTDSSASAPFLGTHYFPPTYPWDCYAPNAEQFYIHPHLYAPGYSAANPNGFAPCGSFNVDPSLQHSFGAALQHNVPSASWYYDALAPSQYMTSPSINMAAVTNSEAAVQESHAPATQESNPSVTPVPVTQSSGGVNTPASATQPQGDDYIRPPDPCDDTRLGNFDGAGLSNAKYKEKVAKLLADDKSSLPPPELVAGNRRLLRALPPLQHAEIMRWLEENGKVEKCERGNGN